MSEAVQTQSEAWQTYDRLALDPRIKFVQEPEDFFEAFRRLANRKQVTPKLWSDDYLGACASTAGLALVTFDHALAARTPHAVLLTR